MSRLTLFHRVVNPPLGMLLRSPLHRTVSGGLALITVTGRRSGREFTFPVGYRQDGDVVRIGVGWPEQKQWWRNLRGAGAPVRVRLRGQVRSGHGVAQGNERDGVVVVVTLEPIGA
jgi:hypothetical protein